MKKILVFSGCLLFTPAIRAQDNDVTFEYMRIYNSDAHSAYFSVTDWGQTSFQYPEEAALNQIEGTVWMSFDINAQCELEKPEVSIGLGYGLDSIALQQLSRLQEALKQLPQDSCFRLEGCHAPFHFIIEK